MRTGKAWREYLLFDFLAIARLSKIKVRATSFINGRKVRAPKEIILEISTTPVRFDRVIKAGNESNKSYGRWRSFTYFLQKFPRAAERSP